MGNFSESISAVRSGGASRSRLLGLAAIAVVGVFTLGVDALFAGPLRINFDEFEPRPIDGMSFRWVDFQFTVGDEPSQDANFGLGGPGQIKFVQDPSLEGPLTGVLTIDFPWPTARFGFGIAQNRRATAQDAVVTRLLDEAGDVIEQISTAIVVPESFVWAEAQVAYEDEERPVTTAVVRFDTSAAQRFAFDNLIYDSPCADFSATPSTGAAPLQIDFEGLDEAACEIVQHEWDFGDGNTAEGRSVSNTFEEPGRYLITLTLTHADGWTATTTGTVSVSCTPGDLGDWIASDVGDSAYPATASLERVFENEDLNLCAGGSGLAPEADSFFFVHQEIQGEGSLTLQISELGELEDRGKVGLMVRSSLAPDAAYASLALENRSERLNYVLACREFDLEVQDCSRVNQPGSVPNAWLRIERTGIELVLSRSRDGVSWTQIDALVVDLPETALFGVFASAGDVNPDAALLPVRAKISNIALTGERVGGGGGPQFRRGDSNADGNSNLTDAVFVLSYLFSQGAAPTCLKAADVDDSGDISLTDAVQLLVFLFQQGAAPPEPTSDCGEDPTEDTLACEEFAPCA